MDTIFFLDLHYVRKEKRSYLTFLYKDAA